MRIWIENGKLIQIVNVALAADVSTMFSDCVVEEAGEWQLYDVETGAPARSSFRGEGEIVRREGVGFLILGNLRYDATLTEYRIHNQLTPESEARLDAVTAGVKAAIGEFKPGRRMKARGADWLRGYDEAMMCRKTLTPK